MNKVFKIVAIIGNVSEVLIASSLVVEMLSKFRGKRKAATTTIVVEDDNSPQPETPLAA